MEVSYMNRHDIDIGRLGKYAFLGVVLYLTLMLALELQFNFGIHLPTLWLAMIVPIGVPVLGILYVLHRGYSFWSDQRMYRAWQERGDNERRKNL